VVILIITHGNQPQIADRYDEYLKDEHGINIFMLSFLSFITEQTSTNHPEWEEVRLAMSNKQIPRFTKKEFSEKMLTGKTSSRINFSGIENTDAPLTSLRRASNLYQKYGKGSKEDFNNLVTAVRERKTPPIIIFRDGKRHYLVGGNTRAMVASALGIRHPVKYLEKG
jgi:hypothetical protein